MAQQMKQIPLTDISYDALLKDIHAGRKKQIASCSSLGWGWAELYRFGRSEYVICSARSDDLYPGIWFGGEQAAVTTWRKTCKAIAAKAL